MFRHAPLIGMTALALCCSGALPAVEPTPGPPDLQRFAIQPAGSHQAAAGAPATPSSQAGLLSARRVVATSGVRCVELGELDNTRTPPQLYLGVRDCIAQEEYPKAAALAALAGIDSRFDAERVTDKSAGQAGQLLITTTFAAVPDDRHEKFTQVVNALNADPERMRPICRDIEHIGFPGYYPAYMIRHGIQAFTAQPGDPTLRADFDAPGTWHFLLSHYLNCPDVPGMARTGTVARRTLPPYPEPLPPGLYQVRTNAASHAADLREETPLRACLSSAMLASADAQPQPGDCSRYEVTHQGHTTHIEFTCRTDGVTASGRSDDTRQGNRRYTAIELQRTDEGTRMPLRLLTEMIFLGPDCQAPAGEPAATANR